MRQWREFSGFDLIFWNQAISRSCHLLIQIISSHFSQLNWVAVCMLMGQVSGELRLSPPDNGWEPFIQRQAVPLEALRFARIYYIFPRLLHSWWLILHALMAFSRTEQGGGGTLRENLRRLISYLHVVIEMRNCKQHFVTSSVKKGSHWAICSQREYVFCWQNQQSPVEINVASLVCISEESSPESLLGRAVVLSGWENIVPKSRPACGVGSKGICNWKKDALKS